MLDFQKTPALYFVAATVLPNDERAGGSTGPGSGAFRAETRTKKNAAAIPARAR